MRRGHLFWPIVLIIVGGVWLLDNLQIIHINIWTILLPVLLIALGISIFLGSFAGRRTLETETLSIPLEGAEKAHIRLEYGAGRLNLQAGARSGELLSGMFGDGVEHSIRHNDGILDARLSMLRMVYFPFDWSAGQRRWAVSLNNSIPLGLDLRIGAVEAYLDLADVHVTDLGLHTGASATKVTLPARAGYTRANIEGGAASIDIRIPEGVAGRIRTSSAISDVRIDASRFPLREGVYESPDFGSAANKVEIKIEMGVGSVTVR